MAVVESGMFERWVPQETPLVVLSDGCFGESQSKLALGVMRYGQWPIAAVIDASRAGKSVRDVTSLQCDAPILPSLKDALSGALPHPPKALLLGTAPPGGQLPSAWLATIKEALHNGLDVINGLHFFLTEEPELVAMARQNGARLWDVRDPEAYGRHRFQVINLQKPRPDNVKVITMVGTDCSVGKMHTALELYAAAKAKGCSTGFIATGQTGILIAGWGVPLDRVIGDFMAGAIEVCIQEEIARLEAANPGAQHLIFVEGQGSLMHPAYSGVTLSLMHGSNPDALILCHKGDLAAIRHYPQIPLPSLKHVVSLYESAAQWVRPHGKAPAKIEAISVNTSAMPEAEATVYLRQVERETGLPATDPVRYGADSLGAALFDAVSSSARNPS
jgi:uncharacterized NAD-dependent epimerase/dehydratase family protein